MEYYVFPVDMNMSNYVVDKNGHLFKILKTGLKKPLSIKGNTFKYTDDLGNTLYISKSKLLGMVQRLLGKYSTRKQLSTPLSSYEITRDGRVYNIEFPEKEILPLGPDVVRIHINDLFYTINTFDQVAKLFVYANFTEPEFFTVSLKEHFTKLVKSPNDPSGFFISKKNTVVCSTNLNGRALSIIKDMPEYVVDVNTYEVFHGPSSKVVEYVSMYINGKERRVYSIPQYDYKAKNYISVSLYLKYENRKLKASYI